MWRRRKAVITCLCDDTTVFNANAKFTRQINTWLDGHHRALRNELRVAAVESWLLMNLQANAMTKAVTKLLTVTSITNHLNGNVVNIFADNPWLDGCSCGLVREAHDIVHLFLLR